MGEKGVREGEDAAFFRPIEGRRHGRGDVKPDEQAGGGSGTGCGARGRVLRAQVDPPLLVESAAGPSVRMGSTLLLDQVGWLAALKEGTFAGTRVKSFTS
ncbi:hypothetical protein GCM10009734_23820 [Nonomuraea bangladeshensis]